MSENGRKSSAGNGGGKSTDWEEGYREGWRKMRSELGNMLRPILRDMSSDVAKNRVPDASELISVSRVYAYIYGTSEMFEDNLKNGRLISEPEIRFARLASKDEMSIPFDELTRRWGGREKK